MIQHRELVRILLCGCLLLVAAWSPANRQPNLQSPVSALSGLQRDCLCSETVTTYPYQEDFEEGMGLWENREGDDFDWDRYQGSTPSDNTGPDADHTYGTEDGYYMYTEASYEHHPDKTAIMYGPCFDLSTLLEPESSFWYHMAGDSMGSLYLEISGDGCATWDTVFDRTEHQGYDWHLAVVDLSDYAGQTIAMRFRGVTSYGSESDMALDDLYVGEAVAYDGGCCNLDTGECLGVMTEAECQTYGNVAWYLVQDCTEDNFCPQPPPANDECVDAVVIDALPFMDPEVDFRWATPDLPVSCDDESCGDSGYGIWYTYTPTEYCGARVTVEGVDGGAQTFIAAFTGSDCDNLTEVFCSGEQEEWSRQEATFDLDAGATYWILVGARSCDYQPNPMINVIFDCSLGACCMGDTCSLETATTCDDEGSYYFGDHSICEPDACSVGACCNLNGCEELTEDDCTASAGDFYGYGVPCAPDLCPPINETCDTAIEVFDGTPAVVGDTTLASFDDDEEASCEEWSDKDLWYVYTMPYTGTLSIDTEGSYLWDTVLSVWDECGGNEFECANDNPDGGSLAALEFDAAEGDVVYIRFAPNWGSSGMFQINITATEAGQGACCQEDECSIDYQMICEDGGGSYGGDDTGCSGEDCNDNGIEDTCDIIDGDSEDCNENGVPDECDIAGGFSTDLDANGVPDECDPDCNGNGIIDGCDVTCDDGCGEYIGCGESEDCQPDAVPDECQLELEGCDGIRYDAGQADGEEAVRPDWGWANYGVADDFTLDEDMDGSCFRFDIYDFADSENLPVMQVRIYENYDGLMDLGAFWEVTPVFDQTYSLDDGNLEITDTGEDLYGYDLLRFVATGTDWELNAGDYAMHLTFPETGDAGFWARAGTDDSDCAVVWGDWEGWPSSMCDGGDDITRLSFALVGSKNNDTNENEIPDDCELFCDLDFDDDVDYDDYVIFLDAFGGPVDGNPPEDYLCDYDGSGAVGMMDYAAWLECYRDYVGDPDKGAPTPPSGSLEPSDQVRETGLDFAGGRSVRPSSGKPAP